MRAGYRIIETSPERFIVQEKVGWIFWQSIFTYGSYGYTFDTVFTQYSGALDALHKHIDKQKHEPKKKGKQKLITAYFDKEGTFI